MTESIHKALFTFCQRAGRQVKLSYEHWLAYEDFDPLPEGLAHCRCTGYRRCGVRAQRSQFANWDLCPHLPRN